MSSDYFKFTAKNDEIQNITDAKLIQNGNDILMNGVSIDSYSVTKDNIYVAIDSRKYSNKDASIGFTGDEDGVFGLGGIKDGHRYFKEAYANGARSFIIDNEGTIDELTQYTDAWILLVDDSVNALGQLARYYVNQLRVKTIGITGSIGKTSTAFAVAACLEPYFQVKQFYRTSITFVGLAIDILNKLTSKDDFLVIEMQTDRPGQLGKYCDIISPNFSIITGIQNSHLQKFGSVEAILDEKLKLYEGLHHEGTLVVNGDDAVLAKWLSETKDKRILTYGLSPKSDVYASNISLSKEWSIPSFEINYRNQKHLTTLKLSGAHSVYIGLAAASICLSNGLTLADTCKGIANIKYIPGRAQRFLGRNDCLVISDSYNANFYSTSAAIRNLCALPRQRRILFLGSMLELAEDAEKDHRKLGQELADIDILVTIGEGAAYVADEARRCGMNNSNIFCTDSIEEAILLIPGIPLDSETAVLVKGSGAMRMELVTLYLLSEPIIL